MPATRRTFRSDRRLLLFALLISLPLAGVFLLLSLSHGRWLAALVWLVVLAVDLIALRGWHDGRRLQGH